MLVKSILEDMDITVTYIKMGEVIISRKLPDSKLASVRDRLLQNRFELLEDSKSILIEKIKNVIVESIHYSEDPLVNNFSEHIATKLGYNYNYLSNLFTEVKGVTIAHYIISHKIERAKELIVYDEMTLTQIAERLNYSSVSHLSTQFKKYTGLTPSFFRRMKNKRMSPLEEI